MFIEDLLESTNQRLALTIQESKYNFKVKLISSQELQSENNINSFVVQDSIR